MVQAITNIVLGTRYPNGFHTKKISCEFGTNFYHTAVENKSIMWHKLWRQDANPAEILESLEGLRQAALREEDLDYDLDLLDMTIDSKVSC